MIHSIFLSLLLLLSALPLSAASAAGDSEFGIWEITLAADESLTLERLEYLGKGSQGSFDSSADSISYRYSLRWIAENGTPSDRQRIAFVLGNRAVPGDGQGCTVSTTGMSRITFRVKGPRDLTHVKGFKLFGRQDEKFKDSLVTTEQKLLSHAVSSNRFLRVRRETIAFATSRLVSGSLTQLHGDSSDNRYRIVFLSEGYRAEELDKFHEDATHISSHLLTHAPWKEMSPALSVYAISMASRDSGADIPPQGIESDTLFNASFWTNGLERLLAVDYEGMENARRAADQFLGVGKWDQLVILVNSSKYGGSGGSLVVASSHQDSAHIVIHELGHSFAGLADEYTSEYPGHPFSAEEPNVDVDPISPKWSAWLTPGVDLPTLEHAHSHETVGAFEGAKYLAQGIFRPSHQCGMRTLGDHFCPVCREAHVRALTQQLSFLKELTPRETGKVKLTKKGVSLNVAPEPLFESGLTFQWYACGKRISGATGQQLILSKKRASTPQCEIALQITYSSPLVRSHPLMQTFTWKVLQGKKKSAATKEKL